MRSILNDQPAPLTTIQQRANGRLLWDLSERLSAEELQQLHHGEYMSIAAIGRRFNVPPEVVADLLDSYGIAVIHRQHRTTIIDPQWLRHEYLNQRRPLPSLAREIGVSTTHLTRQARAIGIPLRPKGGASHEQSRLFGPHEEKIAQDMLATGKYSVREVADELGFNAKTILRHTSKDDRKNVPKRKRVPVPIEAARRVI